LDDPDLIHLHLSDRLYKFEAYNILDLIPGNIYWTDDINTEKANYIKSKAHGLFYITGDILVTGSDLSNLLVDNSMAEVIRSRISEEQGYDFAEKLLSLYAKKVFKSDLNSELILLKKRPDAILVLDMMISLADESLNYLKGMQTRWNENDENKPEIYVLTGERSAERTLENKIHLLN
jgi:hypothetical protein